MGTGLAEFLSATSGQQVPIPASAFDSSREQNQVTLFWVNPDLIDPKSGVTNLWTGPAQTAFYQSLLHAGSKGYAQSDLYSSLSNFGYLWRRLDASRDDIKDAVSMNLQVMHGNPVFQGTRIPIYQIVEELADGTSLAEIPEDYPSLSMEQVQRGLDFAASILRIYDDQVSDR
jgi:uncharacterized protein (DUF433 family)